MVFRMIGLDVAAKKSGQTLRQVFVTQSRTLARKVRLYCAQLMQTETNTVMASAPKPPQGLSLLDMDENAEEEGVLPAKFSELDDCHFPLFVTYDQVCSPQLAGRASSSDTILVEHNSSASYWKLTSICNSIHLHCRPLKLLERRTRKAQQDNH